MAGGDVEFYFLLLPFESDWPEHSAHLRAGLPEPRRAVGSTSPTTIEAPGQVLAAARLDAGSFGLSELWEPQQVQRGLKSVFHSTAPKSQPPSPSLALIPHKQEPFPATLGKVRRRWQEEAERGPHLPALLILDYQWLATWASHFYQISTLCPASGFVLPL